MITLLKIIGLLLLGILIIVFSLCLAILGLYFGSIIIIYAWLDPLILDLLLIVITLAISAALYRKFVW